MLEVEHVSKKFKDHQVLVDVNLKVNQGDVVVILGPSGSGKVSAFSWPVPHPRCQCTAPAVRPADQHIPDSW